MATVFVTNTLDEPVEATYAFKTYVFPPQEPVEIASDAARHIFGYGEADKEPYLARLGWIRLHSDLPKGLERLSKVIISDEPLQTNRSLPSAVGVVPLHVEKRAGGRNHARAG